MNEDTITMANDAADSTAPNALARDRFTSDENGDGKFDGSADPSSGSAVPRTLGGEEDGDIDELRSLLPMLRSMRRQRQHRSGCPSTATADSLSRIKASAVQHVGLGVQRMTLDGDDGMSSDGDCSLDGDDEGKGEGGGTGEGSGPGQSDYIKLSYDTYSLLYYAAPRSVSFFFALLIYIFQLLILLLILADSMDRSDPNNPLGVPAGVDTVVRASQVLAILVAVATQDDLITSINTMQHGPRKLAKKDGVGGTKWQWFLAVLGRATEGGLCLTVTFMLIMQADEVTGMFVDFLAVTFVSTIDDITFALTRDGYFGTILRKDSVAVTRVRIPKPEPDKQSHWLRPLVFLLVSVALLVGWGVIVWKQKSGAFQSCSKLAAQFGDDLQSKLGFFSSIYEIDSFDRKDRPVYLGSKRSAKIAYCDYLTAWTFSIAETEGGPIDPCAWSARSVESHAYDVLDISSSDWLVFGNESRGSMPFQHFVLRCLDCKDPKTDMCGTDGTCVENACVCNPGRFGLRCEHRKPCDVIEVDTSTRVQFPEHGEWPDTYRILQHGDNETMVLLYGRPVYVTEHKERRHVILFTGRRWVATTSESLTKAKPAMKSGAHANATNVTEEELVDFLTTSFHPYWTTDFHPEFMSAPTDVVTPSDVPDPTGLHWYRTKAFSDGKAVDLNRPITTLLLCATCSNTNPCSNGGICRSNGTTSTCKCSYGTFGTLCQVSSFVLCKSIKVSFGDDIVSYMSAFSGLYDIVNSTRIHGRSVYFERKLGGRSMFAYCERMNAWTFTHLSRGDGNTQLDPCSDWRAFSRKTDTFDITTVGSEWFVRRNDITLEGLSFQHFGLECADCDKSETWQCSGAGQCQSNRCVCDTRRTGLDCELYEPCPSLEWDTSDQKAFIGKYASIYQPLRRDDGTYVTVYDRPVYVGDLVQNDKTSLLMIMFFGRRWFVGIGENASSREELVALSNNFHGYYSNYTAELISVPVDPGSGRGASSPVDLSWFLPRLYGNKEPNLQDPLEAFLVCSVCNDLDYPCQNSGKCDSGICSCPNGTFGPLCNVGPVCMSLSLFLSSDLEEPSLSGVYLLKNGPNNAEGKRPVYISEQVPGVLMYCFEIGFWALISSVTNDPCSEWIAKSSLSYASNILDAENWRMQDSNGNRTEGIALLPASFSYVCNDEYRKIA